MKFDYTKQHIKLNNIGDNNLSFKNIYKKNSYYYLNNKLFDDLKINE